jgi:hypothetical protein
MVDDVPLRTAVHNVWSLYLAKHRGVDAADSRRCLLERHLKGRWEARVSDAEELTGFGLAYFERLPEDECWADGGARQASCARQRQAGLDVAGHLRTCSVAIVLFFRSMFSI